MITQAELKQRMHYSPETGIFTWREAPNLGYFNNLQETIEVRDRTFKAAGFSKTHGKHTVNTR